jgi:sulfate adenylyltransferase
VDRNPQHRPGPASQAGDRVTDGPPDPPSDGRGVVVFMTGLSGAGKSTIAEALADRLRAAGREVSILDGDELRKHLSADLGFDRASRDRQVRRAAELAAADAADGKVVIAALMAPFDSARRDARGVVSPVARFVLVHVAAPLEVAEARDPKGLYRRARAGELGNFIGIDEPYEAPADADVVIDTTVTSVDDAVESLLRALSE